MRRGGDASRTAAPPDGWLSALDEIDKHACEAQRLVEVGEVAGALEDLQAAARNARMGDLGVLDGMSGSRRPQTMSVGIISAR
jgi:hypothetical protein